MVGGHFSLGSQGQPLWGGDSKYILLVKDRIRYVEDIKNKTASYCPWEAYDRESL